MLEINFLPWREKKHARQLKLFLFMLIMFFLLLIVLNKFAFKKTIVKEGLLPPTQTAKINFDFLKNTHYVGYIQEKNKLWALLMLENGNVRIFTENSIINNVRIVKITDKSVNFLFPNHQFYLLHLSNT